MDGCIVDTHSDVCLVLIGLDRFISLSFNLGNILGAMNAHFPAIPCFSMRFTKVLTCKKRSFSSPSPPRSQLCHAGALRWDAMDVLSQTWRLLHVGRCTVASCWPRIE